MTLMREQGKNPRVAAFIKQLKCGGESRNPHVCCAGLAEESRIVTQGSAVSHPQELILFPASGEDNEN